ncbi:MAG: ABC transporter permease [Lachnospiraceae bacterium]|jgi:ribose transport system permease protein|nr:ABC transporter permease [Lachnospiraceae bacterium]
MKEMVLSKGFFEKKRNTIELLAALIVISILLKIFIPKFYSLSNITNILEQVSTVGILAVGISFVLVGGGMDISLSANLCCSAVVGSLVMRSTGNIALGVGLMFVTALAFGLLNGVSVAYFNMVPFIVSLSSMVVANGLGVLLCQSKSVYGLPESFLNALTISVLGIPLTIYALAVMVVLYWFILNKSSLGRMIFATGSNENTAVICGVNARLVKMSTYLFSAFSAGLVAVFLTARLGCASMQMASDSTNMDVMCSAILGGVSIYGGKGNIWGAFIGACIIVIFSNLVNLAGINYYPSLMIKGVVIILITYLDTRRAR